MPKSVTFNLASNPEEGLYSAASHMKSNSKRQAWKFPSTISALPETAGPNEDGPNVWKELMKFLLKGFTLGLYGLAVYLLYLLLRHYKGGSSPTTTYFLQVIGVLIVNLSFTHLLLGREEPREFAAGQVARWAETVLHIETFEACRTWIEWLNAEET